MKYTDFFDLLNIDQEHPVAGLFMTYGFDAELFEHYILPDFLGVIGNNDENELRFRNQIALKLKEVPVTVISDGKQYHGGRTFLYDHIAASEHTFHPKCYLLLYQSFLRVIVGSYNITKSGLCYNAETIWYEDIKEDNSSHLVDNLRGILTWISEKYGIQDNYALKEIIKFLSQCKSGSEYPKLLSTINKDSVFKRFFDELKKINEECKEVSILSPFYENDREVAMEKSLLIEFANELKNIYPKVRLKIYFPAINSQDSNLYKVTTPVNIFGELCNQYKDTELHVINNEWEREEDEPVLRNLHAKIIMVSFKEAKKLILSGSINFTNNAMRSKIGSLRNVEIGVLEYGNIKFEFPKSTKVKVDELYFVEKKVSENIIEIFVKSAVLDEDRLIIKLLMDKLVAPFKIEYHNYTIYETEHPQENVMIKPFCLKREQDLHVICKEYDFYVPIQILRKEEFISEDLKLSFKLRMEDIIDYLAGKYKNISDIEKLKRIQTQGEKNPENDLAIYFRHNLQRYYKAIASLKQELEMPYYSELAFKNCLSNPIGLKNLVNLISQDFKDGKAGNEETFLFIIEIENMIAHLKYQEDRLEKDFKNKELHMIISTAVSIRKEIYKKSNKKIKGQYDIMIDAYGLEVK